MEKISLFVVALGLLVLGVGELITWPSWALNSTALFILLGRTFRLVYSSTELLGATLFAIFGLFGLYFALTDRTADHPRLTGRFELLLLLPLLVILFSALSFIIFGAELMGFNSFIVVLLGKLWIWRYNHAQTSILMRIEKHFRCCGWADSNAFSVSDFCKDDSSNLRSFKTCSGVILEQSGKTIYRQGLYVSIYIIPLIILALLVIYSHKHDPISLDIEEAAILDDRRKRLYSGNAAPIQIDK